MKKLDLKRLTILSVGVVALMSALPAHAQNSSCISITPPKAVAVVDKPGYWDVTTTYQNSTGKPKAIKFSCITGACSEACEVVSKKSGTLTVRIQCDKPEDIRVTGYSTASCSAGCECFMVGLPVQLKTFTATLLNAVATLSWTTTSEINNKGFMVEGNENGTVWKNLGFVATKADNGNSSSPLDYEFSIPNFSTGFTQYRIIQVDIDNKQRFSDVMVVRGKGRDGLITIFPNPSHGVTTVSFGDKPHDVSVVTVNGQIIKQWMSVRNNVQIHDLKTGIYFVKILDQNKKVTTQKIVVQN